MKALLVVDLQNDFCEGGALAVAGSARVIAAVNQHIALAEHAQMPIYLSRDWHPANSTHFIEFGGRWPPHCIQDTPGAGFPTTLYVPGAPIIINKGVGRHSDGYSVFDGTTIDGRSFHDDLLQRDIDHLYVCGLATDYCVWYTVNSALDVGLKVSILGDAVAGVDLANSARALDSMTHRGAIIARGPRRPFAQIAAEEGWSADTQVAILLRYVDYRHAGDLLSDFCELVVAEERTHR